MKIDYTTLDPNIFSQYNDVFYIHDDNISIFQHIKLNLLKMNKNNYYIIHPGEISKEFEIVEDICNYLSEIKFPRKNSCIVAIGGGVVGDLAGFIAAIYMRGVDFIQVPTTLLAMVDSSIGGKNGINNKYGKNLIGTIRQPKKIIIDISFLVTLPKDEFINGMAEIIKISSTSNQELWNILCKNNLDSVLTNNELLLDIIKKSVNTKLKIVEKDELEISEDIKMSRMVLNFGHTIGHAIEKLTGEKHGYCVSQGMILETEDIITKNLLISCLSKYCLPIETDLNLDTKKLLEFIKCDKKGNKMITLDSIGNPRILEFNDNDIYKIFNRNVIVTSKPIKLKEYEIMQFRAPGSKSETNRIILIAAFGKGRCVIKDGLICDDTIYMINALQSCGINIIIKENDIIVDGCNCELFDNGKEIIPKEIYVGNSGTCMRFLLPVLSASIPYNDFSIILRGNKWMDKRPMTDLVNILNNHGCNIYENPIRMDCTKRFNGGYIEFEDGISSQYISGIMMSASHITNDTNIKISKKYPSLTFVKLTYEMMKKFNIKIDQKEDDDYLYYNINPCSYKNPQNIVIECDATACVYPIVYSILNDINMTIENIKESNKQGDFELYKKIIKKDYHNMDMDSSDTFMTFCVLFSFIPETFRIHNISNQNKKECKRIDATYNALKKCGVNIKINNDEIIIHGKKNYPKNKNIIYLDCHDDHRLVMSFSLLASKMDNIVLSNYQAISKTYPTFWKDMKKLGLGYNHFTSDITKKENFLIDDVIILIGMPGIGKSTYGEYLAKEFCMRWIDIDYEILKIINCTIHEYIENHGWDKFRQIEYEVFSQVLKKKDIIISTGGGIIEYDKSRNLLKKFQYTILLENPNIKEFSKKNIYNMKYEDLWKKRKNMYLECSNYQYCVNDKIYFKKFIYKIINKFKVEVNSTFLSLSTNNFYNLNVPVGVSVIEYRYDLYPNNIHDDISELHLLSYKPILFTDHSYSCKEEYAQRLGCTIIDIDMERNIKFKKYPNTFIIGSIHSDSYEDIVRITDNYLNKNKPNLIKIVSNISIKSKLDKYVKQLENNYKVLYIFSGIEGRQSRIENKYLTPVCLDNTDSKTNSGQLSIEELTIARKIIYNKTDRLEKYYLFGKPIDHSKSPEIHNNFFKKQNYMAEYYKYETDDAEEAFNIFKKNNIKGASITIPLKESMIKYVDNISDDVKKIGVLNTLTRLNNGIICGDNTDWMAIYDEISKLGLLNKYILKKNIRIYVVGTGATAKSACYAVNKLGFPLYIKGRSREKMDDLKTRFNAKIINDNEDYIMMKIIIVCIPGSVDLDLSQYRDCECIIEMAYNPIMKRKYPKYTKIINGKKILYTQAEYQNKIWRNNNLK